MNSITAGGRNKKSLNGMEDLDTRSESSKGFNDLDTEITGIPSDRTLNLFEEECHLRDNQVPKNEPK